MDFQRRKLKLALTIMAVGMLVALIWHGYQGWVLGKGYPYNTFLFKPALRFGDLNIVVESAATPNPYNNLYMAYFPFTYVIFRYLILLTPITRVSVFLGIISLGCLIALCRAFYPLIFNRKRSISSGITLVLTSIALFILSYPVVFSLDRANIEILMALLTGIALLHFRRRSYWIGLVYLFPAIGFKLYPILLTALFIRSRHFYKTLIVGLVFFAITLISLYTFAGPVFDNWQLWRKAFNFNDRLYVIENLGMAGSASPWNTLRAIENGFLFFGRGHPPEEKELLTKIYFLYKGVALGVTALLVLQTLFIEREFFRRAAMLLILMTLLVPSGGDYRILYSDIAMIVFILLPTRRGYDLWVIGLLAFVLIPKKEFFLSYLGETDSSYPDVSIGVLCNAPCLIAVLFLLSLDAKREISWAQIRRRFYNLIRAVRVQLRLGIFKSSLEEEQDPTRR
jgi:hypothetical protein